MAVKTVTIDESYLQTLLRRAELHEDESLIQISRTTHEALLRDSSSYHLLRSRLIASGVGAESLDLLVREDVPSPNPDDGECRLQWSLTSAGPDCLTTLGKARAHANEAVGMSLAANRSPVKHDSAIDDNLNGEAQAWPKTQPRKDPLNKQTLILSNLPDGASHKDVIRVVRGGRLVDIWLRRNSATVTFAEGAANFLSWARQNTIHMGQREVAVSWSDRQYTSSPQQKSKLANGHSRNLVIRGALGRVTERQIREDMRHIHNLVLLAVVWKGNDIYLSTNSIDKASFAKTCMLSRLAYKGLRIDWYPDECAEPLVGHQIPSGPAKWRVMIPSRTDQETISKSPNRFDVLGIEDRATTFTETSADDDESIDSITLMQPRSAATSADAN